MIFATNSLYYPTVKDQIDRLKLVKELCESGNYSLASHLARSIQFQIRSYPHTLHVVELTLVDGVVRFLKMAVAEQVVYNDKARRIVATRVLPILEELI